MTDTPKSDANDQSPSRAKAKAEDEAGPDKFGVDDLIARATDFVGEDSHVVAAALHGQTKPVTLDDLRGRIKKYRDGTQAEPQTEEE